MPKLPDKTQDPRRTPVSADFPYDATGDVVAGDTIRFTEACFEGGRSPVYVGDRTNEAEVLRDSYGAEKQQHTFTLRILKSSGVEPLAGGAITRRKGRNIYRNTVQRQTWRDENARFIAATEKHGRGDVARYDRDERQASIY
jgi:hypothetical protein